MSLENVLCDVKELQRGMELTWREFSVQHNSTLKDFISRHESRLNKLQEDARIAKVTARAAGRGVGLERWKTDTHVYKHSLFFSGCV